MAPKSTSADRGIRRLASGGGKLAATLVLLLLAPWAWIPAAVTKAYTLAVLEAPLLAAIYGMAVAFGLIATAGAPFLRDRWARWPLVCAFLVAFAMNHVAQAIQGESLSSFMLATLMEARREYDHALLTYTRHFLAGFAILVVLGPFLLSQPRPDVSLGRRFLVVPAAAFALTAMLIGAFTGRLEEFPSTVAVPVQAYFAAKEASIHMGPRHPVTYTGAIEPRFTKVVFIVDESVRGDYLQINNAELDNTPYLRSSLPMFANFGRAAAFSNCSATARVSLRSGARDDDFPDPDARVLQQPTFWQFAKRAGYRTVYLDTWLPVRKMSSMLTYDELTYVDERTAVPLAPYHEADDRVADRIIAELESPGRTFMFVEKIGLHSPYLRNLPPAPAYTPRAGLPNHHLEAARAQNVRDYVVGVWWRVDRFFERLLPALDKPGVLVIYTSDHGQALYDAGYEATNCSGVKAAKGEGIVPLLAFSGDAAVRARLQASAAEGRDRAAHADIFPTLLWAMGFDPARVEPKYTAGLLEIPARRMRRFFVFSPFVKEMQWVRLD